MWTQNFDPMNNLLLSALIAAIPIFFMFWALAIKRMKGHFAGLWTVLTAILLAAFVYGMPVDLAIVSAIQGAIYGIFPIGWIVITAVFLYNITVKTGQFEIIKDSIASITDDRRLQVLLIGFSFGAFLEGAAGFGAPVAIAGGMLVGLGFNPLYAAGLCLIANTAPVAFGAIGIPIIVGGQVTGIDDFAIAQMVGRQLPFLSFFVPFWLIIIMSGFKGLKEVWPAALVSGGSFAIAQWWSSNYLGPLLPDIISSLVSIIALVIFLRFWKPKKAWRFKDEPEQTYNVGKLHFKEVLRAWSPFIILTLFVGDWGMNSVKAILNKVTVAFEVPLLHEAVISGTTGNPNAAIYTLNSISAAGTAILLAAIVTMIILRVSIGDGLKIFGDVIKTLKFTLVTIAAVLGFAYVGNNSGMTTSLGLAFAQAGGLFPLVSPLVGWIGVFVTGSDTSANALFGKLQTTAFEQIGVDPVLGISANSSGGVTGKMISPQSIAVATAATGLVGKEADLFRFTVGHSLFFLAIICVITYLQSGPLSWMIPEYTAGVTAAVKTQAELMQTGSIILLTTLIITLALGTYVYRRKV